MPKLCNITPNFNLVLSNEIIVGANLKFESNCCKSRKPCGMIIGDTECSNIK